MIQKLGLDPGAFENRGLVRTSDVLRALEVSQGGQPASAPSRTEAKGSGHDEGTGSVAAIGVTVRSERLPRTKRVEARHLRSAYQRCLTSTVTVTCRTRGLHGLARQFASTDQGAAAVLIFEVARLLRKYPALNAYFENENINYYESINIGYAVNAGRGLKVPVVRDADRKGLAEVAGEMRELVVHYLGDVLPAEALSGGTFTVTDLAGEGVVFFHPLINQGQSAILGIGSEVFAPGGKEGVYHLVLSFDHQLVDGQTAARFLNDLKGRLEFHEQSFLEQESRLPEADSPCCSRCQATPAELDPYAQYLIQTVRADGTTRLICTNCLRGY